MTAKKVISVRSEAAGATISFEFDDEQIKPSEALAQAFAEAVYKLLEEHTWREAPPLPVALAWSLASIVFKVGRILNREKKTDEEEFMNDVIDTLENFYRPQ